MKIFTARKRSLGQGNIFTPVCHSVHGGGHAWQGGMAGGHAWSGGVLGMGGMRGQGGMHGERGVCMAGECVWQRGHAWQRGACMTKGGRHAWYACPPYEIRLVNARAVCILLECILVVFFGSTNLPYNCPQQNVRHSSQENRFYSIKANVFICALNTR